MSALTLEVLRAEHGDCLLLHHGDDLVLIDGGPTGVYDATLKPRLQELIGERGAPLFLRIVMVSHIDDDHIVGLADMFADALEETGAVQWQAGELWLNAFGALTGGGATVETSSVQSAALDALVAKAPGKESEAIAATVPNGNALVRDAGALGVRRNESVGGGLVETGDARTSITVQPGLTFTVLAPAAKRLAGLRSTWESWERDHPAADAQEAANLDRSVFNLSSIVVLAEADGKRVLLTGDAGSDDILDGLGIAGLTGVQNVDILKLPHHGSRRNVNPGFFARVRARNYVISANGRDGNPDDPTLTMLCDARRGDDEPWTLWLTYGGAPGDGKPGLHERLAAFFEARKAAGQEVDVRFARPGERHTIEA
ncbi:MBL fold metallo-hydrolase [Candidatus Solirubrobacter pratensis]|uniref:MBL fold metallo-hydrolase n=1 Tax=Candidatus Solirubrobacter pratensis TaxID=1298857 RepID=UPI0003F8104F|nr:MBL fold metallo-hydrolase [Candidatus Solirubrobacter pratensis]